MEINEEREKNIINAKPEDYLIHTLSKMEGQFKYRLVSHIWPSNLIACTTRTVQEQTKH